MSNSDPKYIYIFFRRLHVVCPSSARWRTLPINSLPVSLLGTSHCMPLHAGALIRPPMSGRKSQVNCLTQMCYPGGGGGGGGHPRYLFRGRNGRFKTPACPRFCKWRVLFCTQERIMGGQNPLTIHEIYASLTPSDSRSDVGSRRAWACLLSLMPLNRLLFLEKRWKKNLNFFLPFTLAPSYNTVNWGEKKKLNLFFPDHYRKGRKIYFKH